MLFERLLGFLLSRLLQPRADVLAMGFRRCVQIQTALQAIYALVSKKPPVTSYLADIILYKRLDHFLGLSFLLAHFDTVFHKSV